MYIHRGRDFNKAYHTLPRSRQCFIHLIDVTLNGEPNWPNKVFELPDFTSEKFRDFFLSGTIIQKKRHTAPMVLHTMCISIANLKKKPTIQGCDHVVLSLVKVIVPVHDSLHVGTMVGTRYVQVIRQSSVLPLILPPCLGPKWKAVLNTHLTRNGQMQDGQLQETDVQYHHWVLVHSTSFRPLNWGVFLQAIEHVWPANLTCSITVIASGTSRTHNWSMELRFYYVFGDLRTSASVRRNPLISKVLFSSWAHTHLVEQ
jgi:hypothetical protein